MFPLSDANANFVFFIRYRFVKYEKWNVFIISRSLCHASIYSRDAFSDENDMFFDRWKNILFEIHYSRLSWCRESWYTLHDRFCFENIRRVSRYHRRSIFQKNWSYYWSILIYFFLSCIDDVKWCTYRNIFLHTCRIGVWTKLFRWRSRRNHEEMDPNVCWIRKYIWRHEDRSLMYDRDEFRHTHIWMIAHFMSDISRFELENFMFGIDELFFKW